MKNCRERASVGPIVRIFLVFAVTHSLLASLPMKRAVRAAFGSRDRNGLYRFLFNALSVATVVPAAVWFSRLPDCTIYRVRPPWSRLMRAVQLVSLLYAVAAARIVGLGRITGVEQARAWLVGQNPAREPEAQGPPPAQDGVLRADGPFRLSRHPLNLAPMGVFLFFPRMTVNRATLAGLSSIYLILGSMHEERRLRAMYGEAYRRYQESGVPFYLPRFRIPGAPL